MGLQITAKPRYGSQYHRSIKICFRDYQIKAVKTAINREAELLKLQQVEESRLLSPQ